MQLSSAVQRPEKITPWCTMHYIPSSKNTVLGYIILEFWGVKNLAFFLFKIFRFLQCSVDQNLYFLLAILTQQF